MQQPGTLDTLNELAAALGDDASFSTTILSTVGDISNNLATEKSRALGVEATKANLSGAVFTGEVDISGGLKINGEVVNSNATQLNTLIVTPGQATESKALVLDSNRDISGVNEITATKFIGDISGNATSATQLGNS